MGLGDVLKATTGISDNAVVFGDIDLLQPVRVTHKDGSAFLAKVKGLLSGCVHIVDISVNKAERPKGENTLVCVEWNDFLDA